MRHTFVPIGPATIRKIRRKRMHKRDPVVIDEVEHHDLYRCDDCGLLRYAPTGRNARGVEAPKFRVLRGPGWTYAQPSCPGAWQIGCPPRPVLPMRADLCTVLNRAYSTVAYAEAFVALLSVQAEPHVPAIVASMLATEQEHAHLPSYECQWRMRAAAREFFRCDYTALVVLSHYF